MTIQKTVNLQLLQVDGLNLQAIPTDKFAFCEYKRGGHFLCVFVYFRYSESSTDLDP